MDRCSTAPPRSKKTRIARRRDEYVVTGDMERNTGSSLYSRETMIHMSIRSRRIRAGRTVLNRCVIQPYCTVACSRWVSTRLAGNACVDEETDSGTHKTSARMNRRMMGRHRNIERNAVQAYQRSGGGGVVSDGGGVRVSRRRSRRSAHPSART